MPRRFLPGLLIALGVLALGLLVAFTVGRYPVTLAELIEVLVSRLTGRATTVAPAVENVVLLVRGPRMVAAVLVGAALAVAGTAVQGLFRHPLVSPDILGASSGVARRKFFYLRSRLIMARTACARISAREIKPSIRRTSPVQSSRVAAARACVKSRTARSIFSTQSLLGRVRSQELCEISARSRNA